ncbi:Uncharacterized protein TCAP_07216 [Tolypocladium capitatum]|uniref:5-oxoprolinase n=1 Tax=Tolypocladium capitatum TaxID=45235 RepID=A0A2K3Q2V9_9HYPO|nr:Uncharacterized protein TCAP_07216 [Tolypocladium capitatum]
MTTTPLRIRVSIDRGGTFTDVHAAIPGRPDIVLKLLSVDPANYQDAPTEGIRRVLELAAGQVLPRGRPLDLFHFESIRMGTTVATNALLERKGERVALVTTRGFRDLLAIGNQSRPDIFDLSVARPGVLFDHVVEVDERVTMEDYTEDPACAKTTPGPGDANLATAVTGETVRILQRPDPAAIQGQLSELRARGFTSVAVVFVHSYAYPDHELLVGRLALDMGFSVTLSSDVQPMINVVPRGTSAVADAYLTPIIREYIDSVSANFRGGGFASAATRVEFMQSDGGLADYRSFGGLKAILSGPAGGVVGYAQTSWDAEERRPVIGFDMGGTSTDVSRYAGVYDHVFETTTAGVALQSPQLDIHTVAAGGGSILAWRNGLFNVGPESASAHPGPACYRKGGPLTITDANLFLGRLLPEYFPKVFGPREDEPLNRDIVDDKFAALTSDINRDRERTGLSPFSPEEVALGFLKVADEGMASPIRALTEARGHDAADHHLACFGGAGGQHACSVASVLGISRIIIHKYSSILSAYGISLADVVHEIQRPAAMTYGPETAAGVRAQLELLAEQATRELAGQGFAPERISHSAYLSMRYAGSSSSLMILKGADWDFRREFEEAHRRSFGFHFPDKAIIVDDVRVRAVGATGAKRADTPFAQMKAVRGLRVSAPNPHGNGRVYFEGSGHRATPLYELHSLPEGARLPGPALIIDDTQTILVTPGATATILDSYVVIDGALGKSEPQADPGRQQGEFSPIQLTVFGHRFMSIAEQMGRTLRKTAVSTNIKERLDFSCAIFSPDGGLVANAPHVPVHLGSMQFAVQYQHQQWQGRLRDGDVLMSNHPSCGGTHLPDITVITPVFDGDELAFYVASRGHHADIGGILPGSMPPTSSALWQEGAAIESTKLVSAGRFDEAEVRRLLLEEPAKHDGCSGTRCLQDNLSDLKAQIAANAKGILLIKALIAEFGLACVHRYMYAIQHTAEDAVRALMRATLARHGPEPLTATDYMDDGTPISLTVSISPDGAATFDFTGTGPQVLGNTNAPVAITHSAIIYCLRSLVSSSIPLNQGCLAPIDIVIPHGTILNPGAGLAVVGGNVLTSQRVTDVVLRAFRACAASQGCCNNLTFGTGGKDPVTGEHEEGFGYYETIAGGSGAGPTWTGQSGVHTHMTNTRITDPEVFEKRYPCILRRFELRKGSGGKGLNRGGDGVVREIEFRVPVQCSILSERRSRGPYGMEGGGDGQVGLNSVNMTDPLTGNKRVINLGAKATTKLRPGESIIIESPGGGAWGREGDDEFGRHTRHA